MVRLYLTTHPLKCYNASLVKGLYQLPSSCRMEQRLHFPRGPPTPPILENCAVQTIEDEVTICPRSIIEYIVHDSRLVPMFFLQDFPGADQLGREDLGAKIKIRSCDGAEIGIVWLQNADILLPKFAGTTPTLNTFGFRVRGNTSVKVRLVEQIPTANGFVTLNWKWRRRTWIVDLIL